MAEPDLFKARRQRASETFRRSRHQRGQTQVQIWLDHAVKEEVDRAIADGQFKNRSEAITQALSKLLENPKM